MPDDAHAALEAGATGVGLFRTEFLFMNHKQHLPQEEEQFDAYRRAVEGMNGLPVTVLVNYDVVGGASRTDTVESPTLAWTATAEAGTVDLDQFGPVPLDTSVNWQRIAATPTDHRLFAIDDGQPSALSLVSPALQVGPGKLKLL